MLRVPPPHRSSPKEMGSQRIATLPNFNAPALSAKQPHINKIPSGRCKQRMSGWWALNQGLPMLNWGPEPIECGFCSCGKVSTSQKPGGGVFVLNLVVKSGGLGAFWTQVQNLATMGSSVAQSIRRPLPKMCKDGYNLYVGRPSDPRHVPDGCVGSQEEIGWRLVAGAQRVVVMVQGRRDLGLESMNCWFNRQTRKVVDSTGCRAANRGCWTGTEKAVKVDRKQLSVLETWEGVLAQAGRRPH